MLQNFIKANIALSKEFEKLFSFNADDKILLNKLFSEIKSGQAVADVGGGKKPAKTIVENQIETGIVYDGYDISMTELSLAKNHYNEIHKIDLTKQKDDFPRKYDIVICLNTLEHVTDAEKSIKALSNMIHSNGKLYLKLPSKYAMFAKLNLLLPNTLKRKIMHKIFPHKAGDGFKAYYDKSTPNQIIDICKANNLNLCEKNLVKWSSYFSFFFPLYALWRMITLIQNQLITDYCESFELTFIKQENICNKAKQE